VLYSILQASIVLFAISQHVKDANYQVLAKQREQVHSEIIEGLKLATAIMILIAGTRGDTVIPDRKSSRSIRVVLRAGASQYRKRKQSK
jgi:hypothetical protein